MERHELEELQDPESWEFDEDKVQAKRSPRKARAVVSVAFPREQFELVEDYAQKHQMKVSELIRQASLKYVGHASVIPVAPTQVSSGGLGPVSAYFMDSSATRGSPVLNDDQPTFVAT